jgi:hypothetical protein
VHFPVPRGPNKKKLCSGPWKRGDGFQRSRDAVGEKNKNGGKIDRVHGIQKLVALLGRKIRYNSDFHKYSIFNPGGSCLGFAAKKRLALTGKFN